MANVTSDMLQNDPRFKRLRQIDARLCFESQQYPPSDAIAPLNIERRALIADIYGGAK